MGNVAFPGGNGKRKLSRDEIIRRLRVGDLNKLFAHRYRSCRATYILPDDDDGIEKLNVLAHHYASNPIALPRIIKLRAPWADAEKILEEVASNPRKWRADTLGKLLNLSGKEWRQLGFRTITPVDMSRTERAYFIKVRANGRRNIKRRMEGVKTRAEYLESNNLTRDHPWMAEGISKATWYRRRTKRETGLARIKLLGTDQTCLSREEGMGGVPAAPLRSPTPLPVSPDLSHFGRLTHNTAELYAFIPVHVPGQPNVIPYGWPVEFSRAA